MPDKCLSNSLVPKASGCRPDRSAGSTQTVSCATELFLVAHLEDIKFQIIGFVCSP